MRGKSRELQEVADRMLALRGVELGKLVLTNSGKRTHQGVPSPVLAAASVGMAESSPGLRAVQAQQMSGLTGRNELPCRSKHSPCAFLFAG